MIIKATTCGGFYFVSPYTKEYRPVKDAEMKEFLSQCGLVPGIDTNVNVGNIEEEYISMVIKQSGKAYPYKKFLDEFMDNRNCIIYINRLWVLEGDRLTIYDVFKKGNIKAIQDSNGVWRIDTTEKIKIEYGLVDRCDLSRLGRKRSFLNYWDNRHYIDGPDTWVHESKFHICGYDASSIQVNDVVNVSVVEHFSDQISSSTETLADEFEFRVVFLSESEIHLVPINSEVYYNLDQPKYGKR